MSVKVNEIFSGGKLYNLDINIFKSLIFVFPNNKNFLISSFSSLGFFSLSFKGRLIKQFLSNDKWDLGLNKQFFSDSIIIIFNKIKHLSIVSGGVFSSFIKLIHFS